VEQGLVQRIRVIVVFWPLFKTNAPARAAVVREAAGGSGAAEGWEAADSEAEGDWEAAG
jgi:hypothetical protein